MRQVLSLLLFILSIFSTSIVNAQTPSRVFYGINGTGDLIVTDQGTLTVTSMGHLNVSGVVGLAYDEKGDVLYGSTTACELVTINPLSGRVDKIQTLPIGGSKLCQAITVENAGENTFIYVANAFAAREFLRIRVGDVPPYTVEQLGSTTMQVTGMAVHPTNGTLYAINRNANALGILNKNTGQFTSTFGNAGINNAENISFDAATQTLFGVFHPQVLGQYNLTNGLATSLGATQSVSALAVTHNFRAYARPVIVGEEIDTSVQSLHPYGNGNAPPQEEITTFTITHPGAVYIEPYFRRFELDTGDFVIVRDPENTRSFRFEGNGKRDLGTTIGFWTIPIPGETAIVELHRVSAGNKFGILIDKYARGLTGSEIQSNSGNQGPLEILSMCGTDDLTNSICLATTDLKAHSRGKPVARLWRNGQAICTGFLLGSQGHLITNDHCIDTVLQATNTSVEFNAEGATCNAACKVAGACAGTVEAASTTIVKVSPTRDYALVTPDTLLNLATKYGYLQARSTGPVLNEEIYIHQHPAGWGKQVAYLSTWPTDNGKPLVQATVLDSCWPKGAPTLAQDIGYYADTKGGSSGSPVLGGSDDLVVALHHCGTCMNRGVPIDSVISDLGAFRPACALKSDPGCTGSGLPDFSGNDCAPCQSVFDCAFGFDCKASQCISSSVSGFEGEKCCNGQHCKSGVCTNNACTCSDDDHCPLGKKCKTTANGGKSCQDVATGPDAECDSCLLNAECQSGDCYKTRCVTRSSLGIGEKCCKKVQCVSGSCRNQLCQCTKNEHCGEGAFCKKTPLSVNRPNECRFYTAYCSRCNTDKECGPGSKCDGKPFGKCIPKQRKKRPLGEECCRDAECGSGSCSKKNKTCQCRRDSQCEAGFYCDKGTLGFGANQCVAKKAECDGCIRDSQCGTGAKCKFFKCQTKSKNLGESCCGDHQCNSGSCNIDGVCQCKDDNDCGSGQYCQVGFLGIGKNSCVNYKTECESCVLSDHCAPGALCKFFKCQTKSKSIGQSCCGDHQCNSGSCNIDGVCQCSSNGDCPSGQYCATGFLGIGKNSCRSFVSECGDCLTSSQCAPGANCRIFKCATQNSLGKGASCCRDYQCINGNCKSSNKCN